MYALVQSCCWAYDFSQYQCMFDLKAAELKSSILEFPAGLSSFNAELTAQKGRVVSADPRYDLSLGLLREEIQATCVLPEVMTPDVKRLLQNSEKASQRFYQDYEQGHLEGRYIAWRDTDPPLSGQHFDLALTTHWLFSDHPDSFFQIKAIKALLEMASELRIFPLLDASGDISPALGPVIAELQSENYGVELRHVDFEHAQFGNAMLRVWLRACSIFE